MGCFLACFGSSKEKKRRSQKYRVQHRDHRFTNASFQPVQSAVFSVPEVQEKPISPALEEVRDKPVEQLSCNTRKKVTFDSNIKTYEHVSTNETTDPLLASEETGKKEEGKILEKPSQSKSSSEDSSITSSSGSSYPPNHRYQNCRDSDDEDEPLDYEDSDLDDEDEDDFDDEDGELEYGDEVVESNRGVSTPQGTTEDFDSPVPIKPAGLNQSARDKSGYVHSVLSPVENLTQWKAAKARGMPLMKPQKENFTLDQEPRISFSSEPSLSFKSKADKDRKHMKNLNQEMAVDASLSNWLGSAEHAPVNSTCTTILDAVTPVRNMSPGSNSMRSPEDRPILGALTVEELRQFSATSSPRKSPSRSPDEMPIIGTVGTYWNHTAPPTAKGSSGASSYKGIPNTTSKYREDKTVNWHSTPFETRLERALNRGSAAEDCSTHAPGVL